MNNAKKKPKIKNKQRVIWVSIYCFGMWFVANDEEEKRSQNTNRQRTNFSKKSQMYTIKKNKYYFMYVCVLLNCLVGAHILLSFSLFSFLHHCACEAFLKAWRNPWGLTRSVKWQVHSPCLGWICLASIIYSVVYSIPLILCVCLTEI